MLISSRPSFPQTIHARSHPLLLSASAKISPKYGECTPRIHLAGRAGLISGPRTLKMVGCPRALRIGPSGARAGWKSWAKRKTKEEVGRRVEMMRGVRERRGMPRERSRSAEPEVEEEALAPC